MLDAGVVVLSIIDYSQGCPASKGYLFLAKGIQMGSDFTSSGIETER